MKAEIFNFKQWVTATDKAYLKNALSDLLKKSGFQVLDYCEHDFIPFGFTGLWLISESHLAVHTWPEEGKSYIELSSCNAKKQQLFEKFFDKKFVEAPCK